MSSGRGQRTTQTHQCAFSLRTMPVLSRPSVSLGNGELHESLGFRLRRWLRRPMRYKVMAVQFRILGLVEAVVATLMRTVQRMDLETLRKARFEALSSCADIVLADRAEKYLVFTKDKSISKTVYATGSFEFEKLERVLRLLGNASVDMLVDVGANIGTVCIPAVSRGLARKAIAIEPEPGNFQLLKINIELNGLSDRIALYNVAVGPLDGQVLQMELSTVNSGDHRIRVSTDDGVYGEAERGVIQVESQTLDTVLGSRAEKAMLVWMDTQGYEGHVLRGARNLIAARVPLVLEFWPYGMHRAQSYPDLRTAFMCYETYYDLSHDDPQPQRTSNLDALYRTLEQTGGHTDILLV
jgi:FkbM family methyltransferase